MGHVGMGASQRSVLVTGASTGIGLATARMLKGRGWRVLVTARKPDDLARLAAEGFETFPLELTDETSIAACAEAALAATGGTLLGLYNNAAYGSVGALEDISGAVLREHLEANVVGTHELTRRIIPAMRRQGGGRIVLCSSVLGFVSAPYRGGYCASKFALEAIGDALRIELRAAGIHVALIEPGPIATEFINTSLKQFAASVDMERSPHRAYYEARLAHMRAGGPQFWTLPPEAVAAKVVHALESPRPRARYRVTLPSHGAAILKRVLPTRLLDAIIARW